MIGLCPECGGIGTLICANCDGRGITLDGEECLECLGDGDIECDECNGSGEVEYDED